MKIIIPLCIMLLLLLQPQKTTAQSTLYTVEDADQLNSLFERNKNAKYATEETQKTIQKFYGIFKKYGHYDKISAEILLQENPFLSSALLIRIPPDRNANEDSIKTEKDYKPEPGAKLDEIVVVGSGTGSSPNWQTAVLDGTAKFLAQRFKEEMAGYYLNTFYEKVEKKKVVIALFPKTIAFLRIFANQVYNTDIAMLQASAEEDLNNLPENLINALQYIDAFQQQPLLKNGLSIGLSLYKDQLRGESVVDFINTLPQQKALPATYKSYFSVLRILSNALRNSSADEDSGPWEDIEDIDFYDFESMEQGYFYALLYEQLKSVVIDGKPVGEWLGKNKATWINWFHSFSDLFQEMKSYDYFIGNQKRNARNKPPDFWETLSRSGRLVNTIYPVIEQLPGNLVTIPSPVKSVADNTASLFQLIKRVQEKRYEQVIPNIIMLLTSLDSGISNAGIVPYMRYAAVLAQFASIRTADDMKDLLQSVALPIGSASIKRKSRWNVSFNAYVGMAVGQEKLMQKELQQDKSSIGLSAPLGIAISHQYGKPITKMTDKGRLIPSGTLYLSFMDIGNLVNVRLKSDTTSIGEVRFSHFISLGAGYYINFRNSPFTAGISWTYVPGYRDAFINNNWVYKADATRIRFSLLVDIPLFNLYTKPND